MEYANLGSTGLTVSRLCLGCMSYGSSSWRPWILNASDAYPFFKKAFDIGINFFDTADYYSLGESEVVTGKYVREMGRLDEVVIATKVFFPMSDRPNMRGLSRKHIVQACEASLKRLGVETIDLYQIHRFDDTIPIEETLSALNQLVEQGKVRYIGASSGYAWQLMKALSVSELNGWARFVSMQNLYNLLYREEEREMIPLCEDQHIGTVPWSPLARGLLAIPLEMHEKNLREENIIYDQGDLEVLTALQSVAHEKGEKIAAVALAWLLSQPTVVAPVIGITDLKHYDDALRALQLSLTVEEVDRLEKPYQPHDVKVIKKRK